MQEKQCEILRLSDLTEKQIQTLNLLIQHKTSKEISRALNISPHTVDQRIETAKRKFGVSTRGALANAYKDILAISEQVAYEESHIPNPVFFLRHSVPDQHEGYLLHTSEQQGNNPETGANSPSFRVGPEMLTGPMGTLYRVAAIFIVALLMAAVVLAGITIFIETSRMFLN